MTALDLCTCPAYIISSLLVDKLGRTFQCNRRVKLLQARQVDAAGRVVLPGSKHHALLVAAFRVQLRVGARPAQGARRARLPPSAPPRATEPLQDGRQVLSACPSSDAPMRQCTKGWVALRAAPMHVRTGCGPQKPRAI